MAKIDSGYADINGAKIYYEVSGEGHPVVFVHAGIADRRMWEDQFPVFAQYFRTIRFDMRGFGKTEHVDSEYANRDDLFGLLKFLKVDSAHLIGCSIGGGTIMDFALEHPDMVTALVMVGSGPGGLVLDVPASEKEAAMEEAVQKQDWAQYLELATQIWLDGAGRTPEQIKPEVRALALDMNRRSLELSQNITVKTKPPIQPRAGERLNELHMPVLILYGGRDEPYILAAAQYMEDHIAGAKKVLLQDSAHLPSMDDPEAFNRIVLAFLQNLK